MFRRYFNRSNSKIFLNFICTRNKDCVFSPNLHILTRSVASIPIHKKVYFHTGQLLCDKPQYEYDSSTDTFRPKDQKSFTYSTPPRNNKKKESTPFIKFLRRWTRTIFIITGGIVWGGILFVTMFVDVKETSEFPLHIHDTDDEVRLLAFYDIAQGKNELSQIVSTGNFKDNDKTVDKIEELHMSMHNKQEALINAIEKLKHSKIVEETLGKPVQMCGFRAAKKLGQLIQDFQEIAMGVCNDSFSEISGKTTDTTWTAECLMEGSLGIASVTLEFYRNKDSVDLTWTLNKVSMEMLQKSGCQAINLEK